MWFKTLEKSLLDRGFTACEQDPCIFMKKGLVALTYVDDVLFFGTTDAIIDETKEVVNELVEVWLAAL